MSTITFDLHQSYEDDENMLIRPIFKTNRQTNKTTNVGPHDDLYDFLYIIVYICVRVGILPIVFVHKL